ncbi:MAG: YkgJ family cysteine cluster protein [Pseudomonadota bacterium]
MDSGYDVGFRQGIDTSSRLKQLYEQIDYFYRKAATQSAFSCHGCDGAKCCTVDLIVHTSAEMLYMRRGLGALNPSTKLEIKKRSKHIVELKRLDYLGEYRNSVCAANFDGKCRIYDYRPMICRLAGIPHFIDKPNGTRIFGPGCDRFELGASEGKTVEKIDRTPFYNKLAEMEIEVINNQGRRTPSLTIAEILAT